MSACLVPGCVVRGQHIPESPHLDDCKGCLPREAFDPWVVCRWHGVRFGDTLDSLRPFLGHLREIGKPYAQAAPLGAEAHGTPEGYANLAEAIITADELEQDVEWIVRAVVDDAWPVLRRRVSFPSRAPWDGNMLAWLIDHADLALCLPSAADSIAALLSDAETTRHRWPTADDTRPALALDLPCPRCGLKSLFRRPVMFEGQTERIDCTDPDCGRIFTRDEYDRFVQIAARDGKMGKWKVEESA